ncbi:MAG: protein-disulfide reductase DsbD domain-containing protein [Pseudomonadota bacterium]
MFRLPFMLLLTALCLSVPVFAAEDVAQKGGSDAIVQTRLIADVAAVTPGQDFTVLIEQVIRPHWHTYWKNPGDSGTHLNLKWDMPDGFKAGQIQWPTPSRIETPPLVTYGYSDTVRFPVRITVPATLDIDTVTVNVDADWLACEEICIPETATLTLTLPVGPVKSDNTAAFAAARAALPQTTDWAATMAEADNRLSLRIQTPDARTADAILAANTVFPAEWGLIQNAEKPTMALAPDGALAVTLPRDTRDLKDAPASEWILKGAGNEAYSVIIQYAAPAQAAAALPGPDPAADDGNAVSLTLLQAVILAFLGGVVLNLMPCVFPVLSLKALSLVNLAHGHRREAALHGVSYTAGVIVCFVVIAAILIGLQAAGATIGWGFQLQNPVVILVLSWLMFLLGLNLAGFFEIGGRLQNIGTTLTHTKTYRSSFATGLLATIVATPCTAPFMGAALGYAATQPPGTAMAVFVMLGLGLAMPFLLLSLLPGLQHVMPKPGAWMNTFRQALAWPMFLTAAWLVWVLAQQIGQSAILYALGGAIGLGFGLWLRQFGGRMTKVGTIVLLLTAAGIILSLPRMMVSDAATPVQNESAWTHYTPAALDAALTQNNGVLVNMTASWCITCKINERTSLDTEKAHALYMRQNITLLKGDWTNRDPAITAYLQRYGRNGVPLYVFYAPPDSVTGIRPDAIVLPQLLTPQIVADALQNQ